VIPTSLLLELALPVLRRRFLASPMIARPEPGIIHLSRHLIVKQILPSQVGPHR
jgi:hypothetical protein